MTIEIRTGNCIDLLAAMPDASVHSIVTSPPYWRQRDYGDPGQIGIESTPEEYIAKMTAIFSQARRVLRDEGTCFVNLGDKWASGGHGGGGSFMAQRGDAWKHAKHAKGWRSPPAGYKDKDLVGLPFMLAFAMRADGWFWRQCNIWAKPNGMPESVSDRTTASHEYVLHFSKQNDYWYNAEVARTAPQASTETRLAQNVEGQSGSTRANAGGKTNGPMKAVRRKADTTPRKDGARWNANHGRGFIPKQRGHSRPHHGFNERWDSMPIAEQMANGANLRSVWWISPAQFREGHYAVMPDLLAEICILASCPEGGTVLDPFGGAGTTGLVADRHHRNAILLELNPEYAAMAERRIRAESPLFADVTRAEKETGEKQ